MVWRYLLAVDPSLTCSGWAVFDLRKPQPQLRSCGVMPALPAKVAMVDRFTNLQERIERLFQDVALGKDDILVTEAPTTVRDPRAALLVEQVRATFEACARTRRTMVPGRVNPRSVHAELFGMRGRQRARAEVKQAAVVTALSLYQEQFEGLGLPRDVKGLARLQDVVDAILIGHVAAAWIKHGAQSGRVGIQSMFQTGSSKRGKR